MAKEEFKYEEAVRQLESIVEKLENDELDIDSMSDNLKKAQKLIKLCKDKLTKTDDEINKILEKDKK
ncbi:exodeoxyribonuclease VII small subunit [Prevotella herbatica]|uniref:Exodeoxyribonuclease 7 small subunit n=1 Tax=Prevotella herbatica TaxID=2801997 RepID=A0ABM7NVJ2_9BACT|nr:exodeoxyribonuclease VII small subunit [Prevotella herbatica]BCS84388.1 exodeoxyribonuclease VII small subunit [Prevotella herbatica]